MIPDSDGGGRGTIGSPDTPSLVGGAATPRYSRAALRLTTNLSGAVGRKGRRASSVITAESPYSDEDFVGSSQRLHPGINVLALARQVVHHLHELIQYQAVDAAGSRDRDQYYGEHRRKTANMELLQPAGSTPCEFRRTEKLAGSRPEKTLQLHFAGSTHLRAVQFAGSYDGIGRLLRSEMYHTHLS